MGTVLSYVVSFFVIVITVFITLYFKSELERMFGEKKDVVVFHICNVVIILMTTFAAYAVTTIYIMGNEFALIRQLVIHLIVILPIYILGHFAFEKYKFINRKYVKAANGKVLIINEKYLRRK